MKSYRDTYRKIIQGCAFAVLALLMGSCVNDQGDDVNCSESTLSLNLVVPQTTLTKALASDETSAETGEGVVHSLKIWIFKTGGDPAKDAPVAYQEFTSLERLTSAQNIINLTMKVPRNLTNCDFYLLGNSESINSTVGDITKDTESSLESVTFAQQDWNTNLTAKGLPMARIIENIDISGNLIPSQPPLELSLLRSVCKVGFFFSKKTGSEKVVINSIKISRGLADKGNVFPQSVSSLVLASQNAQNANIPSGTTYTDINFPPTKGGRVNTSLTVPVEITSMNPEAITKGATETAEDYKQRLLDKTTLLEQAYFPEIGKSTEANGTYDDKDGKPATCTITYTFADETEEHSKTFDLNLNNGTTVRNHEIIINGFFENGSLYIKPIVLPWDNGGTTTFDLSNPIINFTADGSNKITNGVLSSIKGIATTYDKTSSGKYYAHFTFQFQSPAVNHWMLQLSNPTFGFKKSLDGDMLDFIDGVGGDALVSFYIVPKNDYDVATSIDIGTKLYLTLPDYPSYGNIKFNTIKDNGEIIGSANYLQILQVQSENVYSNLTNIKE